MNPLSVRVAAFTIAVGTLLIGTCAAQVNTAPDATPFPGARGVRCHHPLNLAGVAA